MKYDVTKEMAEKEREFIIKGLERVRQNFIDGKEARLEAAKKRRAELKELGISAI